MAVARIAPTFLIREAVPADAAGIVALLRETAAEGWLGLPGSPHTAEQERVALASAPREQFAVWVGEAQRHIVGHLLLARGPLPFQHHLADVAIAVARQARRQGLGGRLLETAAGWARQQGIRKLTASVFGDNLAALQLFERHGFEREGVRRDQFHVRGAWRHEVVLARFLG